MTLPKLSAELKKGKVYEIHFPDDIQEEQTDTIFTKFKQEFWFIVFVTAAVSGFCYLLFGNLPTVYVISFTLGFIVSQTLFLILLPLVITLISIIFIGRKPNRSQLFYTVFMVCWSIIVVMSLAGQYLIN